MTKKKSDDQDEPSYQDLSRELSETVARLEDPEAGIDESVSLYESALKLAAQLEVHLAYAENRIVELKAKYAKGG